jgi:hypothetical protein
MRLSSNSPQETDQVAGEYEAACDEFRDLN